MTRYSERYSARCSARYSAARCGAPLSADIDRRPETVDRRPETGDRRDTSTAHLLWLFGARFINKSNSVTRGRLACSEP